MKINAIQYPVWAGIFAALTLISQFNYLLFHTSAEIFSIIIACGVFMFAWNARHFLENNYLLFIGISYLFIGIMDFLHTIAYKGLGIFPGYDANLPTQLWIAARYLESICLLLAPFFLNRKLNPKIAFVVLSMGSATIIAMIFYYQIFPACFIEGVGLTHFKKISEYIISIMLLLSCMILIKNKDKFEKNIFILIIMAILLTISSEIAFTFYVSVYGLSNLIGHFFKIMSFYLIYAAIIDSGFKKPYDLLFRNLSLSEKKLRAINEKLKSEITERQAIEKANIKLIADLKAALSKVKLLSGFLPICASCKKIRDDKGYWNKIEAYIEDHSDAEFSHGLCPDCAKKLYPGIYKKGKDTDQTDL